MSFQGISHALFYYQSVASQTVQTLDTNQGGAEKTERVSEVQAVKSSEPTPDFVDEYQPSPEMFDIASSLVTSREKAEVFINDFVEAANMFDALMIAQQKSDVFIQQFEQSAKANADFSKQFLAYKM